MLTFETEARAFGYNIIAGIDEAGRGPLAGPVVASAVILPEGLMVDGLTDSKQLSPDKREKLHDTILRLALGVAHSVVSPAVIDSINILQAARLAMLNAVKKIDPKPDYLLIDGNQTIDWPGAQRAVVKGDSLSLSIAAGSVIAKVTRDRIMTGYAEIYPEYGFENHKGYGALKHRKAIEKYGPCPIHRKTFRRVREFLPPQAKQDNVSLDI